MKDKTKESNKTVKTSGYSKIKDQTKKENEKNCDSGEEVLKKIEVLRFWNGVYFVDLG